MKRDMSIKVVFRKMKGEIIALFPDCGFRRNYRVLAYIHNGQHLEVDYHNVIRASRPADAVEYSSLLEEIKSIYGEDVIIRKKSSVTYN